MNLTETRQIIRLRLAPFRDVHAATVAGWVASAGELLWLAPSTRWPLTVEKVCAWKKPNGEAFVLRCNSDPQPFGYGELNSMRRDPNHLWLGHVVISNACRGQGWGGLFVGMLLDRAFNQLLVKRVSLIVFPENKDALRCYLRVGFVNVGEEQHRFGGVGSKHTFLRLEATAAGTRGPKSLWLEHAALLRSLRPPPWRT